MTAIGQEPLTYPLGEADRLELDPQYARIREHGVMTRVRMPFGSGDAWLATGHAAVRQVLSDPVFRRDSGTLEETPRLLASPAPPGAIFTIDPPEHTRLRRLVTKAFTARRVEALRPEVERIVAGLLDDMERAGAPADLVAHLAVPLPVTVICESLGIPYADRHRFRHFTDTVLATTAFESAEVQEGMAAFAGYLAGLIAQRRENPTDDLLGALVLARDEGDRLSEQELLWLGIALLIGGHETTLNQIANFTYVLLTRPELYRALRHRPEMINKAVEELLRFVPLGVGVAYGFVASEDVELGGVTVRAGEAVVPDIAAANRDPEVFAHPDRIDLEREPNPHVTFGHGGHFCVGSQLARMELQVALGALVRRYPDLRLAVEPDQVEFKSGGLLRGPAALPVAW